MGRDFELWIRATLGSDQFDVSPAIPQTTEWRRLALAGEAQWDWTIRPRSDHPLQTIDASVEVEWRPKAGVTAETVRHTLWKETLTIDVDDPLFKSDQIVTVSRNSVPIGHISFLIRVTDTAAKSEGNQPAGIDAKRYSFVFISYASADRSEVLERVQMLDAMGIKYFQDLLSLDPGDRWEKKLYQNIDKCDLFLLFWSHHAKESEWVIKEAEYALARKGGEDDAPPEIKPVIIEGPPIVLPPPSLAGLHFNDRIIYFMM